MSTLTQTLLGALLDSPAVIEMTSQVLEKAIPIIKDHFTLTPNEITKAYQNGCSYAFIAISVGLDTPSLIQKVRYSNVTREFAKQIDQHYLQPFIKQKGLNDTADFKKQAIQSLRQFSKNTEKLFEIKALTEEDLAALIGHRDTLSITEIVLEQMQRIAPVDDTLADFLRHDDQLGNAVLFFFRELLRQDERLRDTQTALQQEGLCVEMRKLQQAIQHLKAQQEVSPYLVNAKQLKDLQQTQASWQNRHDQLIRFQSRFETRTDEILAWAQEVYTSLDKIEKDVETTKAVVIENNAILQALYGLMAQRGLSSRVSPRDEFTQYDNESQRLIEAAVVQLGQLPSKNPEYIQASIKVGSALSSTGNLEKAEYLFLQAIEKAQNQEDKALAYFNIFQVRWRKAFAELSVSAKQAYYAKALSALQNAIELSNRRYALHDTHKGYYPLKKLLGAGGMGCAFLCENHNYLIKGQQWVVIKCFWENIAGSLEKVFKEPLAMDKIAGEFVPKPLDYGYADNVNKKQPYFVTEYVEGAIDGEAWLEKYGPLSLKMGLELGLQLAEGLRRAHEAGIYHLDLKPANLLLKRTDGGVAVKIIDFGLSRVTTSLRDVAERRSRSGLSVFGQAVFGTLEYAPPEQRGYAREFGKPGAQSDIFAFGKTMYRLLTGEIPFAVEPEPLEHAPEWYRLLSDCVRQNPDKRPESAGVLVSRLKGIGKAPIKEERLIKEKLAGERAKRQAEEERLRKEQQADEKAWEKVCQQNTKSAYQNYLSGNTLKKYADKAKKRIQAIVETKERLRLQKLSPLNPLDYLRLLWWFFVMPQNLKDYREIFGKNDEKRVGNWLSSTLVWLPLLMPTLALGLEQLPHSAEAWSPDVYLWISAMLVGCWLLTALLENVDEDRGSVVAFVVAGVVTFGVAVGVAGVVTFGVAVGVAGVVTFGVAVGVAFGVAFVAAFVAAVGMAFGVAGDLGEKYNLSDKVIFLVGMGMISPFILSSSVVGFMAGSVWVGVAVAALSIVAFVGLLLWGVSMDTAVAESLKTGTPSLLTRITFIMLITTHLFLIYYCFLGGWRLFV